MNPEQQEAILAAADTMAGRWHEHVVACAGAWALLRRLAKAMRHGSPLLPRELVLGPPGAGNLGAGRRNGCRTRKLESLAGRSESEVILSDIGCLRLLQP
jgi:hypothetical protein